MAENKLFYGDCLDVLKELPAESIDLVYLDPPFNSQRDYNAFFTSKDGQASSAQIMAFEDTWQWGPQAQIEYNDIIHNSDAGALAETILPALRAFLAQSDMMAYLVMMANRLLALKRVMRNTASLYLHCDPTASHYLKILLDGVFGATNFRNEIIWRRSAAHNSAKRCGPIHDTIFFYTKSQHYTWNKVFRPYTKGHIKTYFKKEDARGKFWSNSLTGAGIRNGESGAEWNGFNPTLRGRHWAIPSELINMLEIDTNLSTLEKLDLLKQSGVVCDEGTGLPCYKQYLEQSKGIPLQDIWSYQPYTQDLLYMTGDAIDEDVKWLSRKDAEKLGYPTQKPLGLLERIIKSSSNRGDTILDPFCGCGTAIHAAEKLGRKWIGIDITHLAVGLIKRRIHAAFPSCDFEINGTPKDVEAARFLAENGGLDGRYQFQYWALSLVDAVASNDKKKGADSGSDGFIWAYNSSSLEESFKINISVKSGKIPANHIRELGGMIGKNNVEICLLLTLEEPSKKMVADALSYGEYEYPNGKKFPRIQILTIKELLEGKKPLFLDYGNGSAMPKKARREEKKIKQGVLS